MKETDVIKDRSFPMQPVPTAATPELAQLHGIRAVLFDVYGTLFCSGTGDIGLTRVNSPSHAMQEAIDSAAPGCAQGAETLHSRFIDLIHEDHDAARSRGIAHPEVDILEIWGRLLNAPGVFPGGSPALSVSQLRVIALTFECSVNPVWPVPELERVLGDVRQRGFQMGIVSNAQFYTPLIFEALLGQRVQDFGFAPSLCAWSYLLREAKPSQRIFTGVLDALADQGIGADEVVYVGNDMLNDVWTASQHGCRTILFAGDERSLRWREDDARCRGLTPDRVVTGLDQVLEVLPG